MRSFWRCISPLAYFRRQSYHKAVLEPRLLQRGVFQRPARFFRWRSSQENIECMAKVGEQILVLNNAPLDVGWGWIDPSTLTGNSGSWQDFLLSYVQFYHKLLSRENIIGESHFQTLYHLIDSIDFNSPKPCLVHRDINREGKRRKGMDY